MVISWDCGFSCLTNYGQNSLPRKGFTVGPAVSDFVLNLLLTLVVAVGFVLVVAGPFLNETNKSKVQGRTAVMCAFQGWIYSPLSGAFFGAAAGALLEAVGGARLILLLPVMILLLLLTMLVLEGLISFSRFEDTFLERGEGFPLVLAESFERAQLLLFLAEGSVLLEIGSDPDDMSLACLSGGTAGSFFDPVGEKTTSFIVEFAFSGKFNDLVSISACTPYRVATCFPTIPY